MSTVLTANEYHELIDLLMNSKVGQRTIKELQSKYPQDDSGDYRSEYWNEMNKRHVQVIDQLRYQLSNPRQPFTIMSI